jgi:hypothetical protein
VEAFKPTSVVEVETEYSKRLKKTRAERFLRGPIRIDDLKVVAKMDRTCVVLLLLIHFRRDVSREGKAVSLPADFLAEFGIDKSAKQRALKRLEQAKLIDVERSAGHTAIIKLRAKKRRARK